MPRSRGIALLTSCRYVRFRGELSSLTRERERESKSLYVPTGRTLDELQQMTQYRTPMTNDRSSPHRPSSTRSEQLTRCRSILCMNIMAFDGCVKIIMRPASRHTILLPFLVLLIVLTYSVKRLGNLHLSSGHIKSNASRDQATHHHDAKVSYVTSFWAKKVKGEKVNPHRREVEAALLANIYNPHFDQIVVFLEGEDSTESCLDFYQAMSELSRQVFFGMAAEEESNKLLAAKVNCVDVQTEPSYYDMFSMLCQMWSPAISSTCQR